MDPHGQPQLPPDSPLMNMSNSFLNEGMLLLSIPGPSRDPTYYIHDGNSVLLVENTLFKVRTRSRNGGREVGWWDVNELTIYTLGTPLCAHEGQVRLRDHVSAVGRDRLGAL